MNFLVVDDHPLVREALASLLLELRPGSRVQQAASGGKVGPDIVLADHLDYGEGHGNFRPVDTCILPQVTQRGF